eukprot:362896-Chlamydomonas_euryale.AAC.4
MPGAWRRRTLVGGAFLTTRGRREMGGTTLGRLGHPSGFRDGCGEAVPSILPPIRYYKPCQTL